MRTISGYTLATLWISSALLVLGMLGYAHEWMEIQPSFAIAVVGAFLLAAWLRYELREGATAPQRIARDLVEFFGMFAAIAFIGTLASYPDAAASSGYADSELVRVDRMLGFDWSAWYLEVATHPVLQVTGRAAYESIFVSPAILLCHYALAGRRTEARSFLFAFWLAATATLLVFPYMVAVGPLAYLWRGPIPYVPASALYQYQLIPALRSHAMNTIDVSALRGLVEAPSFHAASAVLFAAFGWRERTLRWPLVLTNAAMLLATPVEGTHYLIDVILGVIVAFVALAAARQAWRLGALAPDRLGRASPAMR